MLILIFICTILYGMFANQKKHFWLWCTILLIIMINTSINFADYDAYNKYYLLVGSGSIEPGYHGIPIIWYYLCLLFNKLNLSYNGMMAIIILISMFLINYRIKDLNFVTFLDCFKGFSYNGYIMENLRFPGKFT